MIRFREFLARNSPFEISYHCQKCLVVLRNKLSFRNQTRPDTTSFFYDKKDDCRFESSRGHPIPSLEESIIFISKRKPSIFRRENHQSSRSDSQSIISKRKLSSFRKDSNHHFEKRANPSFRNDSAASFQNDSFVCDKSPINLK